MEINKWINYLKSIGIKFDNITSEGIQPKEGYIGLVKNNSFISKSIQLFMRLYSKKKNVYSHSFMIITIPDKLGLYVVEAVDQGVHIIPYGASGYMHNPNVKYKVPVKSWTKSELNKISSASRDFTYVVTRYDFMNFLYQAAMIVTSKPWSGPKGLKAKTRTYCSETTAWLCNAARKNFFKEPWAINPMDIDLNKQLKDVV